MRVRARHFFQYALEGRYVVRVVVRVLRADGFEEGNKRMTVVMLYHCLHVQHDGEEKLGLYRLESVRL